MMVINLQIAFAGYVEIEQSMLGKELEHVIKKRQPGTDAGLASTVEVKLHPHIGLFSFALDRRDPRRGLRQSAFRFFHKSLPCWNGVSTGSGSDRVDFRILTD